jgi:hypothetical protein
MSSYTAGYCAVDDTVGAPLISVDCGQQYNFTANGLDLYTQMYSYKQVGKQSPRP